MKLRVMNALAGLVIMIVAVGVTLAEQITCQRSIHCPCGNTGKNVTVCIQEERKYDPCSRWSNCKTCQDGLASCLECPKGFEGPLCTPETRRVKLYRKKWQFYYHPQYGMYPRQPNSLYYRTPTQVNVYPTRPVQRGDGFCPELKSPKFGSVTCSSIDLQRICVGRCPPEYSFENWGSEYEITLRCTEGLFTPLREFPPCKYVKELVTCPCKYGGSCGRYGNCLCPAGRTGRFCETDLIGMPSCINPGLIFNGRIEYYSNTARPGTGSKHFVSEDVTEFPEGTRLEYHCDDGYIMEGKHSLTCQYGGIWSGLPPKCILDCGKSIMGISPRILNGTNTVAGQWPWIVAVTVQENNSTRLICGGAVLNTQTVITAAHCLLQARQFTLYFGKYYRSNSLDDEQVLIRRSDRVIIHPDFKNDTLESDIALITFKPKIWFSDRIQPVCLPTGESTARNVDTGRSGYVAGWGQTEMMVRSPELLVAKLPVVMNDACRESFRNVIPNFDPIITQNMFCAGFPDSRQSTCVGDSGSPIVFYDAMTERCTLEGLVSFGAEAQCGLPGTYTICTKVHQFLPWIIRTM